MDNIIEMFKKYAMVIGLVTTLGGGFYAYGVFENRIAQLEKSSGSDALKILFQSKPLDSLLFFLCCLY